MNRAEYKTRIMQIYPVWQQLSFHSTPFSRAAGLNTRRSLFMFIGTDLVFVDMIGDNTDSLAWKFSIMNLKHNSRDRCIF